MEQSVITLVLALLAILAGSFFILYGSIPARHVLPALLVGVLLLSVGTTIPELAITLHSVFTPVDPKAVAKIAEVSNTTLNNYATLTKGTFPVAVILGSCFANLFLVSGLAGMTLRKPYKIESFTYARDLPFLFGSILLATWGSHWAQTYKDAIPSGFKPIYFGYMFLGIAALYVLVVFVTELMGRRGEGRTNEDRDPSEGGPDMVTALFCLVIGTGALGLGVYVLSFETPLVIQFFTNQPIELDVFPLDIKYKLPYAQYGLLFIGLAVALPEILVTLFAWLRGDSDAVAGNLIGSSIFNLTGVLGLGIVLSNGRMLTELDWNLFSSEFGALLIGAGLLAFFLYSDKRLEAWEGFLLVVLYVGWWMARFTGHLPL